MSLPSPFSPNKETKWNKQTNKYTRNQEVPISPEVKLKPKSNDWTTEHIPTSSTIHLNILQPRITEDEVPVQSWCVLN